MEESKGSEKIQNLVKQIVELDVLEINQLLMSLQVSEFGTHYNPNC